MKPIKLYTDLSIHLYEGEAAKKRGTPAPPTPITYLTQWKIVGNSEVHGQEIWSCGEYNATDNKYHILVQPLGGSIADIALTEPLRKVNDVADTIEFPSDTEGKALVTRNLKQILLSDYTWTYSSYSNTFVRNFDDIYTIADSNYNPNLLVLGFDVCTYNTISDGGYRATTRLSNNIRYIYFSAVPFETSTEFRYYIHGKSAIYQLEIPTTELVDAPQIQEADSYSCVISQGSKAVEWSSFETE